MNAIEIKGLCKNFNEKQAVNGLNMTVPVGAIYGFIGENGSGKSTLVKGLLGLKEPSRGEILFGEGLRRREIGYLPQQTQLQRDFPASVREVVLSGCINTMGRRLAFGKEERERAAMNMERMGIEHLAKESYQRLSGGQQQRVLLARALCATKKLLLLDEPVTGLDPIAAGEMYNLIKLINLCDNITVIMVSHDIHEATRYATHILHLGQKQLFYGSTCQYKDSEYARRFLGGNRI